MLGMMNSPSDNIEFYSSNRSRDQQLSEEDAKTFTQSKNKLEVTYTKDGKRLINGKSSENINAQELWTDVIRRSTFAMVVNREINVNNNDNSEENAEKESDNQEPDPVTSDKAEDSSSEASSSRV